MSKKAEGGAEKETTNLYVELNKLKQAEDYEKAIKACNKILNVNPQDELAFHCKIVSMIHSGKFADTLKQIDNCKFGLDLRFEMAYCYYRLNDPLKALEVIDGVKNPQVKHKELRAQILYRLENYEDCFNVYRDLVKSTSDDYETERRTNLSAVTANLADEGRMLADQEETFELRYNAGCNLLAVEDYSGAEEALREAEKAAKSFLAEEEATEEEIDDEIGIIKVQLGYVMQKQGREKEAQIIYNQVLKSKPSDTGLVAVASNNLLTLNKDQNIFDSKKRMKAATVEGLELKLTTAQRVQIARNNALLAMYTAQVDQCKQLVEQLDSSFTDDKRLIVAGALARSGKSEEAADLLTADSSDPVDTLMAGHILLASGEAMKAIKVLFKLPPEWKYRTGVLSTLVTLELALERRKEAAKLLKEAVTWGASKKKSGDMAIVWRKTAEFHLKTGEAEVAATSLEELLRLNSKDMRTLAQLVLAYAKFDLSKALAASKKLPPFAHGSVDVDSLESSSWAMGAKHMKKTPKVGGAATPQQESDIMLVKKKTKKKRKKRLPKNYNPNVDPDPERWLPRRERTGLRYMPGYRKPRKDKRKGEKFTGAQGTAAGQSETYDYSAKAAANKAAAASPEPAAPQPQKQHNKRAQNKGKKKGGKKQF